MPTYDVPGVYIEEQTGAGVIVGVSTSTAALIGPALRGPINEATFITSYDEFLAAYAVPDAQGIPNPFISEPQPSYLAHAVQGFYQNGGGRAYIVRVGTGVQAWLPINNQGAELVFTVKAGKDGSDGKNIQVQTESSQTGATTVVVAVGKGTVTAINGVTVTVDNAGSFRMGDRVTVDNVAIATITQIQGNILTLDAALAGLAVNQILQIANLTQPKFRLSNSVRVYAGAVALLNGKDVANPANSISARVVIKSVDTNTGIVTLVAAPAQPFKMDVAASQAPTLNLLWTAASGSATVTAINGVVVTVDDAAPFRVGDNVTVNNVARAGILQINGKDITLNSTLAGLALNDNLQIANLTPGQVSVRVTDITNLMVGSVVMIEGDNAVNPGNIVSDYALIDSVDTVNRSVTLRATPARINTFAMTSANPPSLIPTEFDLVITPPGNGSPVGRFSNLSLEKAHPRYILNPSVLREISEYQGGLVQVSQPAQPPIIATFPQRLVKLMGVTPLAGGVDDNPATLTSVQYQAGLDVLRDIDDVSLVCIPDASSHPEWRTIQQAMRDHCYTLKDRFAILDSIPGAPTTGAGSVTEQRQVVESDKGFAALYYPWLEVRDPSSTGPVARTMFVPPSGHIAGIYARIDENEGVHKSPANTDVRGVLGLERKLSNGQHGPLNEAGINAIRIYPNTAQVVVMGARTSVNKDIPEWRYISVRRLMLFIEESIEDGLRPSVFEPNNTLLWGRLKFTISEFLERVWRDGALFGTKREEAFFVRIDSALNTPSTMALGRLYIEIGVRPSYPAEFIIVRIGLWDGGSAVNES